MMTEAMRGHRSPGENEFGSISFSPESSFTKDAEGSMQHGMIQNQDPPEENTLSLSLGSFQGGHRLKQRDCPCVNVRGRRVALLLAFPRFTGFGLSLSFDRGDSANNEVCQMIQIELHTQPLCGAHAGVDHIQLLRLPRIGLSCEGNREFFITPGQRV